MAIAMEFLQTLPLEAQKKIMKELSVAGENSIHIEIDGKMFLVPEEVNDLIESLSAEVQFLKDGLQKN